MVTNSIRRFTQGPYTVEVYIERNYQFTLWVCETLSINEKGLRNDQVLYDGPINEAIYKLPANKLPDSFRKKLYKEIKLATSANNSLAAEEVDNWYKG